MALHQLLQRIREQGQGDENAVVSLEDFFEGNQDASSIACNHEIHPGMDEIYRTLRALRARREVRDVGVGICEVLGHERWPFADRVLVVARAHLPDLRSWTRDLCAEPIERGWLGEWPRSLAPLLPHHQAFTIWWE